MLQTKLIENLPRPILILMDFGHKNSHPSQSFPQPQNTKEIGRITELQHFQTIFIILDGCKIAIETIPSQSVTTQ